MKKSPRDVSSYQVVDRLLVLRNLLRARPHTWLQIVARLPDHYTDDDSGKRKLRRDLQYLARWGYAVERDAATKTYALTIAEIEHAWTEKELLALAALRASFVGGAPYAETIQGILEKIEQGLGDDHRALYKRKPALTIKFTAAEETAPTTGVRQKLESAINCATNASNSARDKLSDSDGGKGIASV